MQEHGQEGLLTQTEQMSYVQLREALKDPAAREDIKFELVARLVMMMRFGFAEMEKLGQEGASVFGADVTGKLGTYLNLLARLLNSFPRQPIDNAIQVELERIDGVVKQATSQEEETRVSKRDDPEAPENAPGPATDAQNDE
jgi:hypothetical protein